MIKEKTIQMQDQMLVLTQEMAARTRRFFHDIQKMAALEFYIETGGKTV
jgi:hypothetical protein